MAFFPRAFASEFAPIFRLMDDYASHAVTRSAAFGSHQVRQFQPRFDVKENKDSYELQGELPGVQRENLSIEFTDHHTLSIKGRTESHREEGTRPGQIEAVTPPTAAIETPVINDAASEDSTNYHKASVEDEDAPSVAATSQEAASQTIAAAQATAAPQQSKPESSARYWISERSVGSFARSFQFPSRVDQDNVKASLANGILSIVIPKSTIPQSRRINVE